MIKYKSKKQLIKKLKSLDPAKKYHSFWGIHLTCVNGNWKRTIDHTNLKNNFVILYKIHENLYRSMSVDDVELIANELTKKAYPVLITKILDKSQRTPSTCHLVLKNVDVELLKQQCTDIYNTRNEFIAPIADMLLNALHETTEERNNGN